jgi:hypothetical protein
MCAFVALLLSVAGCAWNAAPPMYYKGGVDLETRRRDEQECVQASLKPKPSPDGKVALVEERSAYHDCMKGRGYVKLKD